MLKVWTIQPIHFFIPCDPSVPEDEADFVLVKHTFQYSTVYLRSQKITKIRRSLRVGYPNALDQGNWMWRKLHPLKDLRIQISIRSTA